MGDRTAFFYGTLMAREVLYRVCYGTSRIQDEPRLAARAESLIIRPAILQDFCRHRVKHADYPGIIQEPGQSVRGTYVTGLTDDDIFRLDYFEGNEYERQNVKVEILNFTGADETAMEKRQVFNSETYVYTAGESRLEKGEWDFEHFRNEKMHNWADHSLEYEDVDKAVEMVEGGHDPTGGRSIHAGIKPVSDAATPDDKAVLQSAV